MDRLVEDVLVLASRRLMGRLAASQMRTVDR
jgi:hypothetical protein